VFAATAPPALAAEEPVVVLAAVGVVGAVVLGGVGLDDAGGGLGTVVVAIVLAGG
jgi:hypothetical protein